MFDGAGGVGAPQPNQPEKVPPEIPEKVPPEKSERTQHGESVDPTSNSEPASGSEAAAIAPRGEDQLEISPMARFLAKLRQEPDLRHDKIEEARQKITDGAYDGDEVLKVVGKKMIEEGINEN